MPRRPDVSCPVHLNTIFRQFNPQHNIFADLALEKRVGHVFGCAEGYGHHCCPDLSDVRLE